MANVWYLSYGSNMLEERFLCYIKGLTFKGNGYKEEGCRDKTLPRAARNIKIKNDLYFAKASPRWSHMGVAFIGESQEGQAQTYARMYLIDQDQFEDVVKQENRMAVTDVLAIDYDRLRREGSQVLFEGRFYGKLLFIGMAEGCPIYTFTCPSQCEMYRQPSPAYLVSIMTGIYHNYGQDLVGLFDVFSGLKGIEGHYTKEMLEAFMKSKDGDYEVSMA